MNNIKEVRKRIEIKKQLIGITQEEIISLQISIGEVPPEPDLTMEQYFEMVEDGRKRSDGHFTLMAFTTGWKAMFRTPDIEPFFEGYDEVFAMRTSGTPQEAIMGAIYDQAHEK